MQRFSRTLLRAGMVVLSLLIHARAQGTGDPAALRFDFAYHLLRSADDMRAAGNQQGALYLYEEATKTYLQLMREYPSWDPSITRFRATYCQQEFERLTKVLGATAAGRPPPTPATNAPPVTAQPPFTLTPPPAATSPAEPVTPPPALLTLRTRASRHLQAGEAAAARSTLLEALRLAPDDVDVRLMIATAQCMLGEYGDAVFVLKTLAEEQPDSPLVPLALSGAYVGIGALDQARDTLLRLLEKSPDSMAAHADLAQVLLLIAPEDKAAARTHYARAVALGAPSDPALEARLAESPPSATMPAQ